MALLGSFWNGINVVQLDTVTGKPISNQAAITNVATHTNGIEASFLFKLGSYYYLFVSWDKCCQGASSTYNIRFGRATSVTGPYLDTAGVSMKSGGGTLSAGGRRPVEAAPAPRMFSWITTPRFSYVMPTTPMPPERLRSLYGHSIGLPASGLL